MLHIMQDRTVQFIGTKKTGNATDPSNGFRVAPVQVNCTCSLQEPLLWLCIDVSPQVEQAQEGLNSLCPAGPAALPCPPMLLICLCRAEPSQGCCCFISWLH